MQAGFGRLKVPGRIAETAMHEVQNIHSIATNQLKTPLSTRLSMMCSNRPRIKAKPIIQAPVSAADDRLMLKVATMAAAAKTDIPVKRKIAAGLFSSYSCLINRSGLMGALCLNPFLRSKM
jgi:hypothetical protein